MTRTIPGEFAADALIRLSSLNSLDKATRLNLLEEAFRRASQAQEPLKRTPAVTKVPGAAGFLQRAYAQDLDALTLRVRAVEATERIDPAKARSLFQQIPAPKIPRVSCADFLVYDVESYYRLLPRFASPQRMTQEAGGFTSPVQIAHLAEAILETVPDDDFQSQLSAFVKALARVAGDDRSFTFERDLGPHIHRLSADAKRRGISPLPLLESYRVYLVNNQQAARCADDDLLFPDAEVRISMVTGRPVVGGEGVVFFNSRLRTPPLQPIQGAETIPVKLEGVAEGLRGCQDSICQALSEQYSALILDPETKVPYPAERKSTPAWREQLRELLAALEKSRPSSSVAPAQYYRERSAVYLNLLAVVPAGELQQQVVDAMLSYAEQSELRTENRLEWFLPVNVLIGRMGLDPLGFGRLAGRVRDSKDPVIALYGSLEKLAPRTPDKIMVLM